MRKKKYAGKIKRKYTKRTDEPLLFFSFGLKRDGTLVQVKPAVNWKV